MGDDADGIVALGKRLFERDWKPTTSTGMGDGLGPAFNDRSCIACHRQGAIGGGGPLDKNVDMLSLPREDIELSLNQARKLRQLHPGFVASPEDVNSSIVLHKFVLDKTYANARRNLIGDEPAIDPHSVVSELAQHRLAAAPLQTVPTSFDLTLVRGQRNSSALFGAGLIDQIPDSLLLALESEQPRQFPGITGRAAPAVGGIGRFGWRAKTARLSEFVLQACANELGLQVAGNAQGMVPGKPDYSNAGTDMTSLETSALVAFVAALPKPRQVLPNDPKAHDLVRAGSELFTKIGCAACHRERLGEVSGLYSDLLLHDMGQALADPAPAQADTALLVERKLPTMNPAASKARTVTRVVVPIKQSMASAGQSAEKGQPVTGTTMSPGYYGGGRIQTTFTTASNDRVKVLKQPTMTYQEWRTPPLWGVHDSAPYLHDGRAATLVEAIAWHGGEAQAVTQLFFALPAAERVKILAFLRTLRAPVL